MAEETSLLDTIRALNAIGVVDAVPSLASMKKRAEAIVEQIRPIARWATKREYCYWIYGDKSCSCYCRKHAVAALNKMRRAGERDLWLAGGPSDYDEHDSPPHCETCGVPLLGSLTDHAVSSEMEHFASYSSSAMLSPHDAAYLVDVLVPAAESDEVDHEEFEAVCAWLEDLLARGAVEMPDSQGRCRMTLVVARDRKRRCRRRRRIARVACAALKVRCAVA